MRITSVLVAVSIALTASRAVAVQLELGWDTRVVWDSNPLRSSNDEEPDFSFYGGPNFTAQERGRRLEYLIDYRLRYEQYVELSSVNGFEHFVNGELTYRLSPRTTLLFSQRASRTRGLSLDFIEPVPGIDPVDAITETQIRRTPTVRSTTRAGVSHRLTPLWTLDSSAELQLYEYEEDLRSDVASFRGSAQLTRPLTKRAIGGFGAAVTRQDFHQSERSLGTGTTIYEAFAIFRYQWDPTLFFSVSIGPAWSQPDDDSDSSLQPIAGVLQDPAQVTRLVDPSRCVLPVPGTPAGTLRRASCPRVSGFYVVNGQTVFLPSALITSPDARIDPRLLELDEVDVLGDSEGPEGSLTYFGRVMLHKDWQNFDAELSYQRRTSTSSGLGTTNVDIANARLSWIPDRQRWRFDLRGTWTLQSSATEQPFFDALLAPSPTTLWVDDRGRVFDSFVPGATEIPNAARVIGAQQIGFVDTGIEIETIRVDLRATRRFGPRFTAEALAGWWRQQTEGDFRVGQTVDDLRFQVGFTWTFAPIEL